MLVSDLPVTAFLLNMQAHKAKYGCTLCLVQIQNSDNSRYYPLNSFKMRTSELHEKYFKQIERNRLLVYRGVKCRTKVYSLIPNLPLTAQIDVMHQVFMTVTKVLLQIIQKKTTRSDLLTIENGVKYIAVSVERQLIIW